MGDIADMFSDYVSPEEEDWIDEVEENLSKSQWKVKGGLPVKFRNMETSHIKNCIAYIQRNQLHTEYATFADYIDVFNKELERREKENNALYKAVTAAKTKTPA